jgi:hypothetical protein
VRFTPFQHDSLKHIQFCGGARSRINCYRLW